MPSKLRGSLSKSLLRSGNGIDIFYCTSCAIWRRTLSTTTPRTPVKHRGNNSNALQNNAGRAASTQSPSLPKPLTRPITTTTSPAIHTIRSVPPRFKELYEALERIKDVAPEQVNLSRLQLALRGLETETPVVRVAVLGLNDAKIARKLVHLLLADPLCSQEEWEVILKSSDEADSRGLLIRYGETAAVIPNDLLPTISVPSPSLRKGQLEILVSTLGADTEPTGTTPVTADTFLVPTVTIRSSHSGRHNVIRYPVHRTLVCGQGADDLLAWSALIARSDLRKDAESVRGAIDLALVGPNQGGLRVAFVDVAQAEAALAKFRESVQNASEYERGWNGSGVQSVLDWLGSARQPATFGMNPALQTLIEALLDSAEESLLVQETEIKRQQERLSLTESERRKLNLTVRLWAERAHTELRDALDEGFASKRWRRLTWWRLFWRVDDVGAITAEILEKRYLRQAEKEVIYTAGRFQQAGLLEEETNVREVSATKGDKNRDAASATEPESLPMATNNSISPWPSQIATSRARLLTTTIPSLQALAQNLVLFSVSTTTLTSALSALTYVSVPAATAYEACTFAVVGLIWSLRRQQKKWDDARKFWETEVREEGRTSLRETEGVLQRIVRDGGRKHYTLGQSPARTALDRSKRALAELTESEQTDQ